MLDHMTFRVSDLPRTKCASGLRPHYHPDYYGAFVIDPDGNNVEAACHQPHAR